MPMPDLKRAVAFRGFALNTWTESNIAGQTVVVGCQVKLLDPSAVEIRQFTEGLALVDGIDTGGAWLGARKIAMRGVIYDKTRGEAFDQLATLEPLMLPESGTMGFYDLTFYTLTGASSTPVLKTVSVRPNGLRFLGDFSKAGGDDSQPTVLEWSVDFFAKNPGIT